MSSRYLLSFILTAAVAMLGVSQPAVAQQPSPSDGTGSLSASSGGCVPPSAAVDLYLEAVGSFGVAFGQPPEEACEDVCKKFEKTCDDIAHNARVCGNRGGGKFASLLRTTCSTLDDEEDRDLCRNDVNAARNDIRDCNNEDRIHAGACCDRWETEVCLNACLDESYDLEQCFTGPGGLAGGSCWFHFVNTPS